MTYKLVRLPHRWRCPAECQAKARRAHQSCRAMLIEWSPGVCAFPPVIELNIRRNRRSHQKPLENCGANPWGTRSAPSGFMVGRPGLNAGSEDCRCARWNERHRLVGLSQPIRPGQAEQLPATTTGADGGYRRRRRRRTVSRGRLPPAPPSPPPKVPRPPAPPAPPSPAKASGTAVRKDICVSTSISRLDLWTLQDRSRDFTHPNQFEYKRLPRTADPKLNIHFRSGAQPPM
jgi:hypothetical protein